MSLPVDFIDLTQDSPITSRWISTRRSGHPSQNRPTVIHDLRTRERVPTTYQLADGVINLDDTLQSSVPLPNAGSNKSKEKVSPPSCPICFEDLSPALKPISTRCGHVYCSDCLQATLRLRKKCPMCQSCISEKTCIRLHF